MDPRTGDIQNLFLILVSYCCLTNHPKFSSLLFYFRTILEMTEISFAGLKSRCQQSWFLLEPLRGEFTSLSFSASSSHLYPLAAVPPPSSKCTTNPASVNTAFSCDWPPATILRALWFQWAHRDNLRQSLHLKSLNLITAVRFLLLYKVTIPVSRD